MYAGLTRADKPALLDAQAKGAEWVACDKDDQTWIYKNKPRKGYAQWDANAIDKIKNLLCCRWGDPKPFHIPTALAQIAEMEWDEECQKEHRAMLEKKFEANRN